MHACPSWMIAFAFAGLICTGKACREYVMSLSYLFYEPHGVNGDIGFKICNVTVYFSPFFRCVSSRHEVLPGAQTEQSIFLSECVSKLMGVTCARMDCADTA